MKEKIKALVLLAPSNQDASCAAKKNVDTSFNKKKLNFNSLHYENITYYTNRTPLIHMITRC